MGQSAVAIIGFGIDFGTELPWERYDETPGSPGFLLDSYPQPENPFNVEVVYYGAGEYPSHMLVIKESVQKVYWDKAEPISRALMEWDETQWSEGIQEFLEHFKIKLEKPAEPKWLLAAYFG